MARSLVGLGLLMATLSCSRAAHERCGPLTTCPSGFECVVHDPEENPGAQSCERHCQSNADCPRGMVCNGITLTHSPHMVCTAAGIHYPPEWDEL